MEEPEKPDNWTAHGGRKPVISDQELLEVFLKIDDPVSNAPEVQEYLPIGKHGTLKRLNKLAEEEGLLGRKKLGNDVVFWLTEEGNEYLDEKE